ncbi:MAG: hypothetical protein ACI9MC_003580, partial [Kiritimatiellia bacterium]
MPPYVRNLLIGLIVLYVLELVVANFMPGGALIWTVLPWTPGFELSLLWQP